MSKHALQQVLEDAGYECQSYGQCLGVRVSGTVGSFFADVLNNIIADDFGSFDYANSLVEAFRHHGLLS